MVGVVFAFNVETANARIEATMHSLNSMAGIRKYRIHDELPITFSSEDTLLEAVSARGEESEKLKENPPKNNKDDKDKNKNQDKNQNQKDQKNQDKDQLENQPENLVLKRHPMQNLKS